MPIYNKNLQRTIQIRFILNIFKNMLLLTNLKNEKTLGFLFLLRSLNKRLQIKYQAVSACENFYEAKSALHTYEIIAVTFTELFCWLYFYLRHGPHKNFVSS